MLNVAIQLTEVEYHMEYGPRNADRLGCLSGQLAIFSARNTNHLE